MPFDPSAYPPARRTGQPRRHAHRASRSRRRPATSSKSRSYGPGVFRLRAGPDTRPDYGIVAGRAQACAVAAAAARRRGRSPTATRDARDHRRAAALAPAVQGRRRCSTSCTDCSFDGTPRLPDIGRLRRGEQWIAAFALASRRAGLRPGRKIRPARQARPARPFAGRRCARRQHRRVVQERAFRVEPRRGAQRRVGRVRAHAGHGDARRRLSRIGRIAPTRSWSTTKRSTSSCSRPTRPPAILDLYTQLTGRAPAVPRWSLGLWVVARRTTRRRTTRSRVAAQAARARAFRATC